MQELAKAAGVSKTTVSLALRNHVSIGAETRRRIQRLAEQMGYRANPFVSALLSSVSRSKPIPSQAPMAYVSDETERDIRREPRRKFFWQHTQQRAAELGYRLDRFWLGTDGLSGRRLAEILRARSVHGIVFGIMSDPQHAREMDLGAFACASITLQAALPTMHGTEGDIFRGALQLYGKLAERGYRRIGLAMDVGSDRRHDFKHMAALTAFHAIQGWGPVLEPLEPALWEPPVLEAWRRRTKPDVVVTMNSEVLGWLKAAGLRVPEDIGYANLAVPPDVKAEAGLLSDAEALCGGAVDLVDAQLHRNERGLPATPKRMAVMPRWLDGPTVRPASQASGAETGAPAPTPAPAPRTWRRRQ